MKAALLREEIESQFELIEETLAQLSALTQSFQEKKPKPPEIAACASFLADFHK